ncbi:MAG: bifunctional phosphoglucose/phosphomannose isomerase [Candidatus Omnitrophica bacterium]|nr:bifunctional phosphoglucose/phosphomannose isomerase [Candidatus Omnitrophota bacterium]
MTDILDDRRHIKRLDKSDMLSLLMGFSAQLKKAMGLTGPVKLPNAKAVSSVVFSGLGGSAIGGDVARCCLSEEMEIPFIVNRDYDIPAFVGPNTLFFASSYSGNTEETLSAYKKARDKKAVIIVLTSGGRLAAMAASDSYPVINIPEKSIPPRCALGYSFVPVLSAFYKMGLAADKSNDIVETIQVMDKLRDELLGPGVKLKNNPSKKIAGDLYGQIAAIYGGGRHLDCVITRWRGQFCENSKSLATSHFLPEMDHNEIMGYSHPKAALKKTVAVFLKDMDDHPRVKDRIRITARVIKRSCHKVVELNSTGNSLLARICSLIYVGDFASFYLAILNGEDPTPVDEITYLKKELSKK